MQKCVHTSTPLGVAQSMRHEMVVVCKEKLRCRQVNMLSSMYEEKNGKCRRNEMEGGQSDRCV